MPLNDTLLHGSRRTRSRTENGSPNPFRHVPLSSSFPTRTDRVANNNATTARLGKASVATRGILTNSSSATPHLAMVNTTLVEPPTTCFENDTPTTAAATYTGAAILSSYTNRRKMLQKASALSSQMHKRVEDVVQMEEEQRLLSQAYRSRQKLAEQEQEQAQTQQSQQQKRQQQQQQQNAEAQPGTYACSEPNNSPTQVAPRASAEGEDGSAEVSNAEGGLSTHGAATTDGYGVVLDGASDTKRLLQQQAQEKNEALSKMRGMQLAIQELSAEVVAEEERWLARSHFTTQVAAPNGEGHKANGEGEDQGDNNNSSSVSSTSNTNSNTHNNAPARQGLPPDVISKLDAIRDLRLALKDMLDARRPHPADSGSYGTSSNSGGGSGADINTSGGTTWVEQDAVYNPPPPPQVFSTNALAVTLEYVSDSMASMARIADEFCIATTFRARSDRLTLLPHLHSLEKWTAQAELSLETTQRHLRHFHIGETAVLEGGAYEVNSLREQMLLLKESLTAQDQKVKATKEAQTAVLHRLREIRQRCRMWEFHLLHRQTDSDKDNRSFESPQFYAVDSARTNRPAALLSTPPNSGTVRQAVRSLDATTVTTSPTVTAVNVKSSFNKNGVTNMFAGSTPSPLLTRDGHVTDQKTSVQYQHHHCTNNDDSADSAKTLPHPQQLSTRGSAAEVASDASPPPRMPPPTSILVDFLPKLSTVGVSASKGTTAQTYSSSLGTMHGQDATKPPSPSAMDRMERRIAQSWGNPYVHKRLLRKRAEAAAAAAAAAATEAVHHQDDRDMMSFPSSTMHQQHQHLIGGDEGGAMGHSSSSSQRLFTSPHTPHFGGPSPTVPNAAIFSVKGSASLSTPAQPFPNALQEEHVRRSQVSTPLQTPLPGFGEASDFSAAHPNHRTSRAFGSVTTVVSLSMGAGDADLAELADVRTMQLLQSLLRCVPSNLSVEKIQAEELESGRGGGGGDNSQLAETPLGIGDIMLDETARESTRRSTQRLIQFLKAQTKQPIPNQPSVS